MGKSACSGCRGTPSRGDLQDELPRKNDKKQKRGGKSKLYSSIRGTFTRISYVKEPKIDSRDWERQLELWLIDPVKHEKPGPHPDKNHKWNTKPELFILDERTSTGF